LNAHKVLFLLAAGIVLGLAPFAVMAATLHVDDTNCPGPGTGTPGDPFCTIQDAYDALATGDTILVAPGTYNECVIAADIAQPTVHLIAEEWDGIGPSATIIDATGAAGCTDGVTDFATVTIGGDGSELKGFTIKGSAGSGVVVRGSVTITNNVVTENSSIVGGGIFVYTANCYYGDTTTTVENNTISNNDVTFDENFPSVSGRGGGIFVNAEALTSSCGGLGPGGSPTVVVQGNTIQNNTAQLDGGGIYAFTNTTDASLPANVTITQNTISGNLAGIVGAVGTGGFGGGVFVTTFGYYSENITISDNPVVADNRATGLGGGIAAQIDSLGAADHNVIVQNNNLSNNQADEDGGGLNLFLYAQQLDPTEHVNLTVTGNSIVGNTALGEFAGGGGLLATLQPIMTNTPDITLAIEDNRITDNHADFAGGGASLFVSAEGDDASLNPQTGATGEARGELLFKNNIVARNESIDGVGTLTPVGGGIFTFLLAAGDAIATLNLQLNTIVDNTTEAGGGGIELESWTGFDIYSNPEEGLAVVKLQNSIVANNSGFGFGGPNPGGGTSNRDVNDLLYNDLFGNGQNYEPWVQDRTGQDGNLSVDPMLGAFPNYIPMICSPTIDAGDPALARRQVDRRELPCRSERRRLC